ncbi:MAG: protein kinase, partial [Myxococcota bacterium]|nr:protein kinase [Myxococcota bacterium]
MPELDNAQVIELVKNRLGLNETVIAAVRSALASGEDSVEDVLVDMGVLTRSDLDSLIGHLPTQAGLKGVTADDDDPGEDWPTDGGRAEATALTGDALRDSLLPQLTMGSERYVIGDEFARGGMGIIADAKDRILERNVAMKLLIGGKSQRLGWQLRFAQEAQITGQLQHPNIVPVYDLGETDEGQLYFSMKRVEGQTLRDVFKALRQGESAVEHTFSRTGLLQVFQKICMAVAYAHSRAVVHR